VSISEDSHMNIFKDRADGEVLLNVDGVDILARDVEAVELIGGLHREGGRLVTEMNVTFREPAQYFEIDLSPKTCIGCGAKTDANGQLPCGH
jgi:hypothetical protein